MTDQAGTKPADVIVRGNAAGFLQEVINGKHHLRADEPTSVGGGGAAPGPYDYLLIGLGACTSMTVGFYARSRKWPLDNITVSLRHSRIHAKDCAECETKEGMLDRIDVEVGLTGALTDEQRAKLMEIAGKCPVHRTLTSEINIRLRAAPNATAPPTTLAENASTDFEIRKGKQTMKTKLLTVALLASAALIAQAQAGGHGGGGRGSSGGFGVSGGGGFSSFHGAPMGNLGRGGMMYSGQRFSASGSGFRSYYGGAYAGRSIGSRQFSGNINRNSGVARSANGERRIGNSSRAGSSSGQIRSGRNLPSNWQNHVVAQHSANWQRNWNRNRDHFWNGHHCRFINGSWFIFDFGFYPWWPYWYPYDYYGYGYYPGYYDPYGYDGGDYYGYSDESAGSAVAVAQKQLARQGYYRGEIDGIIGPQTRRAIARYQSNHGLEVTGALTPDTLQALQSQRS